MKTDKRQWRHKMDRGWYALRDRDATQYGEGSDAARAKALLLAECADAEFIESIIRIKVALDAFGGKALIGAKRIKFDPKTGEAVANDAVGSFETVAYIAQYDAAPVRGEPTEPDTTFADAEAAFERGVEEPGEQESAPEPVPAEA